MSHVQDNVGSAGPVDSCNIDVGEVEHAHPPTGNSSTSLTKILDKRSTTSRSAGEGNDNEAAKTVQAHPADSSSPSLLRNTACAPIASVRRLPPVPQFPHNPFLCEQHAWGLGHNHRAPTAASSAPQNYESAHPARSSKLPDIPQTPAARDDSDGDGGNLDVDGGSSERITECPATSNRGFIDVGGDEGDGQGSGIVSLRVATQMIHEGPSHFSEDEDAASGSGGSPVACLGDFKFTADEVSRMSKRYPTLTGLASETAVPLLGWLAEELGLTLEDMRNLVMRHPRLMAYRVKSHLEPKTKWLRERLHLGQAQLKKLVMTYPAVLSRSVESNLEPKLKWLEERLGASEEEVGLLIKRFPVLFGYSTSKNLDPTVDFFTEEMKAATHDVKSTVLSCPAILSRSLDKRIMPRTQQMRAREITPMFELHKWVVTTYTDAQFKRWLDGMRREMDLRRKDALHVTKDRRIDDDVAVEATRFKQLVKKNVQPQEKKPRRTGGASEDSPTSWKKAR